MGREDGAKGRVGKRDKSRARVLIRGECKIRRIDREESRVIKNNGETSVRRRPWTGYPLLATPIAVGGRDREARERTRRLFIVGSGF